MQIVVLDGYTVNPGDNPWTPLETLGNVTIYDRTAPSQVVQRSRDAQVLVINKVRLGEAEFAELDALKLVTVTATGYDCVDVSAAAARGITVCHVPVYGTQAVAQFTWALLLELAHHVALHDQHVRAGEWARAGDFSFWRSPQIELAGRRMGIVGWGRIGQQVGKIAHAVGMEVWACSRSRRQPADAPGFRWADLPELAAQCDVLSLHCPLTDETAKIINHDLLLGMQPTTFLINTARGGLVDEPALATALREGRLAGAAVDVVSSEPIADDNPLLGAPNCIITPHMAWASHAARQRLLQHTVENIRAFLQGTPIHTVTPA